MNTFASSSLLPEGRPRWWSLLYCRTCDQPFFSTVLADGSRAYRSRCGCRLWPFDVDAVERRVYAEAQRRVSGPIGPVTCDDLAALVVMQFARITLGATVDDIVFVLRVERR